MKLPAAKGRFFRLLPSVVIVGGALLVVRTSDLVHAAYAEASEATHQNADLTDAPVPANPDYAGAADDAATSAAEVDVMSSLAKRRRELDARQAQMDTQANMLAATEKRVDAKIAQLKQLQDQITALLGQRDDAQKAQIAALVKTYSNMKPKDAARIFNSLPDDVLVPVAQAMKADVLGTVLANMSADNAQKLTVKLADRLTLPQTTNALAPAGAPAAAAASAAPATASAAPAKPGG
ncbi:MAG: hypothetical protein H6924_10025 [Alphaproteobacteria bacterium]|nr:hypothetical protein [Alphaproteobacteria bacterium]